MPTIPTDGRRQFSGIAVMMTNHRLGRRDLFAGTEQIGPDTYVVSGSWPSVPLGRPSMSEEAPQPEAPKTAATALWPNLPRSEGGER
jgi:hypothetical protein